jgi:hypothetical protein
MAILKKIINADKDAEKGKLFYTAGGIVDWYSHHGKQDRKPKIDQSYDPVISLLDRYTYPKKYYQHIKEMSALPCLLWYYSQ